VWCFGGGFVGRLFCFAGNGFVFGEGMAQQLCDKSFSKTFDVHHTA